MKRTLLITVLGSLFMGVFLINLSEEQVSAYNPACYNNSGSLPYNKVGLVLGTAKTLSSGRENYYYRYRVQAAHELFKSGKVDYLLISGDNSRKSYNEPEEFKADLMALGVPESRIVLDFAGFRTLDSVERAKAVFGCESFTVISQRFHNERALFIAESKGVQAVAFNARDVGRRFGLKTRIRERLARAKAWLDVYVLNTKPKFYGPQIKIG